VFSVKLARITRRSSIDNAGETLILQRWRIRD